MVARNSWAVQDAARNGQITVEDARVATALFLTPGLRGTGRDTNTARFGFRPGTLSAHPGQVTVVAGKLVVQPFQMVMPTMRGATSGGAYLVTVDQIVNLDPLQTPAHATYSRIDRVIVCQTDTFYGDTESGTVVRLVTGTPASDPQVPDLPPGDCVELARVNIPAGTTALSTPMVADQRPADLYTVALGGILPIPDNTALAALSGSGLLYPGFTCFNIATGWLTVRNKSNDGWLLYSPGPVTLTSLAVSGYAVNQLGVFGGELYRYTGTGWVRQTFSQSSGWSAIALSNGYTGGPMNNTTPLKARTADNLPVARMLNADTVQLGGQIIRTTDFGMEDSDYASFGPGTVVVGTLPAALRPAGSRYFAAPYGSPAGCTTGAISANGNISFFFATGSATPRFLCLDGITFHKAAQSSLSTGEII